MVSDIKLFCFQILKATKNTITIYVSILYPIAWVDQTAAPWYM